MTRAFPDFTAPARSPSRPPTGNRAGPAGQTGFTLLEVIVAFVITALVLGAALDVFSTGISSARRAGDYAGAVVRAEAMLNELGIARQITPGTRVGRFGDHYAWRLDVRADGTPYGDDETPGRHRLYAVQLTISWGIGAGTRQLVLNTHRTVSMVATP